MIERRAFIQDQWEKTGGANPLGEYSSFQEAVNAAPNEGIVGYNTFNEQIILTCIDEGINARDIADNLSLSKVSIMRTAGSGILAKERQRTMLQNNKDRIKGIVSHTECGAAGIYAQNNNLENAIDAVANEAAIEVAQDLGTIFIGSITPKRRPSGLHIARAIYYDGTETGFEASNVETLPLGFGISRGFVGREAGMDNVRLAKSIAMGETGFANQFSKENPLYLVGITDNREGHIPPTVLRGELEEIQYSSKNPSNLEVKMITLNP